MNIEVRLSDLLLSELKLHQRSKVVPAEHKFSGIVSDSRKLRKGDVFFAFSGNLYNGHDHIEEALSKGAAAICVEDESRIPMGFDGIVLCSDNTRRSFAKCCYLAVGSPADSMMNIGVTGTNGKTTTTHWIEFVLARQKFQPGVIGTIDHHLGEIRWPTLLTTPGPEELSKRLQDFFRLGANALVMEVSSHAMAQCRADGIPYDVAVFTNLTRDHLDFHDNLENYFQTKKRLFTQLLRRHRSQDQVGAHDRGGVVINTDDPYGKRLSLELSNEPSNEPKDRVKVITLGQGDADLRFRILSEDFSKTSIEIVSREGTWEIQLQLPCRHNVYNALSVIGVCQLINFDIAESLAHISKFRGVPGRLQKVENTRGVHAFVDFAHTDDALKRVLESLDEIRKKSKENHRIITVFGCGGDRDRGKRPLMFKAARSHSDVIIVTSDNPRSEDPHQIISEITKDADPLELGQKVFLISDRREAIQRAVSMTLPGDVLIVAGKGHEDYQIIGHQRVHFSDLEVLTECLK